jgi:hypothetical protein
MASVRMIWRRIHAQRMHSICVAVADLNCPFWVLAWENVASGGAAFRSVGYCSSEKRFFACIVRPRVAAVKRKM